MKMSSHHLSNRNPRKRVVFMEIVRKVEAKVFFDFEI